jgi:hypothetical protein
VTGAYQARQVPAFLAVSVLREEGLICTVPSRRSYVSRKPKWFLETQAADCITPETGAALGYRLGRRA